MKQLLAAYLVILTSYIANGQNFIPLVYDTLERHHEINLHASGELSSSAISNQITSKLLFGGEISNELINKIEGKHKALNRLGLYAEPTLEYINYKVRPFKKKDYGIVVKAGYFASAGVRYQKGAYGLLFRGNEPYLGSTIDLSNMFVGFTAGYKVGFGLISAKSKSSVSLNLYGITNYINGYLNTSSFSQDETGFNAALALDGTAYLASSSPYFKGLGVGVDANFFFKLGNPEKPSFIQFSIQNLGVAFLSKNIQRYQMDTTIIQDGYTISNLTNNETIFGKDKEIADELGLQRDTVSRTIALPFTVQIGKIIDDHNTKLIQMYYGVRVYVQNAALPMAYYGLHLRTKNWFRMGLGISYGGYTGFRGNLYLQATKNNFNIGIATSDIVGLVGVGKGYGLSLTTSFRF